LGTLDVDERREDLPDGEGDRDFAALGDSDRRTSEPGVDARELALLKGSDLARILFRLRDRSGGLSASIWCSGFGGSKLAWREGGAKSMLISGGDIASAWPNSGIGWFSDGNGSEPWPEYPFMPWVAYGFMFWFRPNVSG